MTESASHPLAAMEAFCQTHPLQTIVVGGIPWEYLTGGSGQEAILLLTGGLGRPESAHMLFGALEESFKVIAPAYPPVGTMAEVVEGLCAILDREGFDQVHIVGGSYGGMVAQCVAEICPGRIRKMVLTHTGAPKPDGVRAMDRILKLLRVLPGFLLRWALRARFRSLVLPTLRRTGKGDPKRIAATIHKMIAAMDRNDVLNSMARVRDYYSRYGRVPVDGALLRRGVLIIESDSDPAVPDADRETLKQRYPGARVKTFTGAGHVSSIVYRSEFLQTIREFLAGG